MEVETTRPPPPPPPRPASAPFMPSSLALASGPAARGRDEFTADDLAAADQLVQLSVSGGGEEDQCCCSSSARSVNNAENEDDDDEEHGAAGRGLVVDRRARKRYRLVSELYAGTRQVKAAVAGGARKRKGMDGVEN